MSSLPALPEEVRRLIFSSPGLTHRDWKSLRQVCQAWTWTATDLLFYRIGLSKLKKDRDAFFNIVAHPHLSTYVRVIVWHELGQAFWNSHNFLKNNANASDDDFQATLNQISDLFWLTSFPRDTRKTTIDGFKNQFNSALDALPNVNAIVSQPMHSSHQLTKLPKTAGGYPLTARLLRRGNVDDDFKDVLAPTLIERSLSGDLTLKRLHFTKDVARTSFPIPLFLGYQSLFKHLTDLYMRFAYTEAFLRFRGFATGLMMCLEAASSLVRARLCFECGVISTANVANILFFRKIHLPKLHTLCLENVQYSPLKIGVFLKRHAATLRDLTLYSDLTVRDCELLGQPETYSRRVTEHLQGLTLDRLTIVPMSADTAEELDLSENDVLDISEAELLAFVNTGTPSACIKSTVNRDKTLVRTHWVPFGWATSLDWEISQTIPETALDEAVSQENQDTSSRTESCPIIELIESCDRSLHKELDEDDADIQGGDYAAEQASHSECISQAPHWVWEALPAGEEGYYCHRSAQNDSSYPTQVWLFQHRNGQLAVGDEPLEYWEDWQGSEAGDTAEPIPFGPQFTCQIKRHPSSPLYYESSNGVRIRYRAARKETRPETNGD
ncbi:hypothetical protein F4819DRAFT_474260 [Hypoxylon fuscum]|nr:hypothetical protein F4819DRAFT_474260 [Hypoxylon fuscum]